MVHLYKKLRFSAYNDIRNGLDNAAACYFK